MAIITYPLNGIEYTASDAETYLCTRSSGVYATDSFIASITGSRQVTISKGLAWIHNSEFAGKSVVSTENTVLTIPTANSSLPRIDRIVLRFSASQNASTIVLKQGTPASNPIAPAIERTSTTYELGLCDVSVPAGSIYLSAGDLKSTLLDEELCGLMTDGVTSASGDYISIADKGAANGVASLDSSGKVPQSQIPVGVANGVASLDGSGKLPSTQLPIGVNVWTSRTITSGANVSLTAYSKYTGNNISILNITKSGAPCYGTIAFSSSVSSVVITGFEHSSGDDISQAKANEVWEFSVDSMANGGQAIIWKNWSN